MTKMEVAHEERSEEPHVLAMRGWKAVPVAEAVCVTAIKKNQIRRLNIGDGFCAGQHARKGE